MPDCCFNCAWFLNGWCTLYDVEMDEDGYCEDYEAVEDTDF